MNKRELLLVSALTFDCQSEPLPILEHLPLPKIEIQIREVIPDRPKEEPLQEQPCTIDLSNRFIPQLLAQSRDAEQYFTTKGILQNPFQRERFGIFSDFQHHKESVEHYAKAIELRGNQAQPKIELKVVPYTTPRTLQRISALEKQLEDTALSSKQAEQRKRELNTLRTQLETIKKAQQILQWEGFYSAEINGIYDLKTTAAVMEYQRYQQQRLRYDEWLKIDGRINSATRELLNKDFEEYALGGINRVLEERVFHAQCENSPNHWRSPYVIEQHELETLTESTSQQLRINSLAGIREFLSKEHATATVGLKIPKRYKQNSMRLEVEVEKWEVTRAKSKLHFYTIEEDSRIELFQTKVVVGGWVREAGGRIFSQTPEREFYLKNIIVMPYWNPRKKAPESQLLPGPHNAFGMFAAPLYYSDRQQQEPFRGWQSDDNGYRIHLTPWPSSVEYGGSSHGCIRIHPSKSRIFYFLAAYTPHLLELEEYQGKSSLKFTVQKGSIIPFQPEHYIKVRTCKESCK